MNSGVHCGVSEIYALLVFYRTQNDSFLQTFWVNPSVPSSGVKQSKKIFEDETDKLL